MKVIVGLGNPGDEYRDTRHNVGFMVVDAIATAARPRWRHRDQISLAKHFGTDGFWSRSRQTFMNRAADAVAQFMRYYGVGHRRSAASSSTRWPCRSVGCVRGRAGRQATTTVSSRSSSELGTTEFARLRVGRRARRSAARSRRLRAREVRARPSKPRSRKSFIARAADAAEMFAVEGIEKVMNALQSGRHGAGC